MGQSDHLDCATLNLAAHLFSHLHLRTTAQIVENGFMIYFTRKTQTVEMTGRNAA